jgi:hypothetical protein
MLAARILALLLGAAPAGDEPLRAGLDVDASELGDGGDALEQRLETRGQAVLREAEVLSPRGDDDPVVSVKIEALPEDAGYRCAYELRRRGEPIEGTQASSECRLCTDVELESQFTAALERLVPKLSRSEEPMAASVPPPTPTHVDAEPHGWTIGRMGQAGIGVTAVGAGTLGVGLGLAVAGADGVRVSGIATAAIGGAILVTGVVLLAVDRTRSGRVRATATGMRVRF